MMDRSGKLPDWKNLTKWSCLGTSVDARILFTRTCDRPALWGSRFKKDSFFNILVRPLDDQFQCGGPMCSAAIRLYLDASGVHGRTISSSAAVPLAF